MRALLIAAIVAVAGWSAWWWFAASAQKFAWRTWLEDRQAAGWVAETSDISVRGYPNRIDTTLSDVRIANPKAGWAWSGPFFQTFMLSYKPNHIIAVWPSEHTWSTPRGDVSFAAETMRGSVGFVPDTNLTLDRTQIEIRDLGLTGSDWASALKSAQFASRRVLPPNAPEYSHQIGFDAMDLTLAKPFKRKVDPLNILPEALESAHFDLVLQYDQPWGRKSVETTPPRLLAISVKDVDVIWGKLRIEAKGQVAVDRQGQADGALTIKARNWREIISLLSAFGIPSELTENLESGLAVIARLSGDPRTIEVPLTFRNGQTRIGPVSIGPAPMLVAQ